LRYGFVIDHDRCIGCHACTVACKEEHNIPVGVFRTWVKYIEKGEFPDTRRHFGVMRCNHCDAAPCVEICPTRALFRRDDGIVDFDNSRCIGCKSCMQACPYDALYIDPNSNTAAKCNFCAHRVELNLEPACVIVCPTRAIIAGDLDDPRSDVSNIVATRKVAARKPQKGTLPKLFYAGIEGDFLQPSSMEPRASHAFADLNPAANLYNLADGNAEAGPAPGAARVVYDVAHPQPWGWIPALYLWTKSIAAGILILAGWLAPFFAPSAAGWELRVESPIAALAFIGLTAALLVADLKRPDRFYYILIKPNPRSWLVWGTWILIAAGLIGLIWLAFGLLTNHVPQPIAWMAIAFGFASACYSGFLFAQAKARDLWHSPLFIFHLAVQAIVAGAAALILIDAAAGGFPLLALTMLPVLRAALVAHLLMMLGETVLPPSNDDVRHAVRVMTRGVLGAAFWFGAIIEGAALPFILAQISLNRFEPTVGIEIAAAVTALAGLLIYEYVWIAAGQAPPLS
jgi:Fe-S-cluster-containing dehydrogenase component/formate-dependent nitrite reductase membrane component NrfD